MATSIEKSNVNMKITNTAKIALTKYKANNEHKTLSDAIMALLETAEEK